MTIDKDQPNLSSKKPFKKTGFIDTLQRMHEEFNTESDAFTHPEEHLEELKSTKHSVHSRNILSSESIHSEEN